MHLYILLITGGVVSELKSKWRYHVSAESERKKGSSKPRKFTKQKMVTASIEQPQEFIAVSFKEVIELFIEVKKEQAKAIQETKDELLSIWQKITKEKFEKT